MKLIFYEIYSSDQYKTTKRIFVFITKCNIAKSILTISKGQRITILTVNENRLVNRKKLCYISYFCLDCHNGTKPGEYSKAYLGIQECVSGF